MSGCDVKITCEDIEPRWRAIGADRQQVRYRAIVNGVQAGEIVVVELQPDLAFVAWVQVHPTFRRRGIALALHTRAAAVHGTLAVEDFANPEELALWNKLATNGWAPGVIDGTCWQIYRRSNLVGQMLTVAAPAMGAA